MRRTVLLQEVRQMRFKEVYGGWKFGRLTQEEAATILGVCDRTFRRYLERFEEGGMEALLDKRISQASPRKAPVDEVLALADRYRDRYRGWNARHFHSHYRRTGGSRSYTWVKKTLQEANLVEKAPRRGVHRKRRERSPLPGMMIHQDGSTHEWVPGKKWDLIVTMDDATNEHYSMFFVEEEGTWSSFRGVRELIRSRGVFCTLYTDRGSHYWTTPEEGGTVDRKSPTQFGRAMRQLGVEMIPAYSPEARGRSERMFGTHQDRLTKELVLHGITDMDAANRYLEQIYLPAFNEEFTYPAREEGSAFVPWIGGPIDEILCEVHDRQVGNDNCVSFERIKLQIPADRHRCHYIKASVRVHRYENGSLAVFHGPRRLANYNKDGKQLPEKKAKASA